MNDAGEALGSEVHGGLLAHTAERAELAEGTARQGHTREQACLNCGAVLLGPHCHRCGQQAHVHRTLSAFFHDLLHGVLHFEGKIWRTLPMLLWQPGRLTREYIDGRRARYVSPVALFLFVIFLSFAVFQLLGGTDALAPTIDSDVRAEMESAYTASGTQLSEARAELAGLAPDAPNRAAAVAEVAEIERDREALAGALRLVGSDAVRPDAPAGNAQVETETKSAWQKAKENPQLLAYKVQTNVYKFAWLLIPISVPFVWLLYCWKRRFRMYDHTVFTTYSITFMVALAGLSALLIYHGQSEGWTALEPVGALLLLYAPVHMYRQLRGAYGSSRLGAFGRMLLLSLFAWIAIGLFATVLATMA